MYNAMLKVFTQMTKRDAGVSRQTLTLLLIILMFCAWFTDITGIYAIFSAFVLGAVTPCSEFAQKIR
jgi:Kef-type K+ transport system membrane component KefB